MKDYTLSVYAYKEVTKDNPYGHRTTTETQEVTVAELYEAVSKYLQVKGYQSEGLVIRSNDTDKVEGN